MAATRPRPSGRGGNAASPPRKCQRWPIVCSHVQVPAAPHPRPGGGAAAALRPRPVRVEPGRRAAPSLAPGQESAPGYLEQCRQLTAARAEYPWLRQGSQMVQQQALRDFAQAMAASSAPGQPGRAAVVAQGRAGRGVPGHRAARACSVGTLQQTCHSCRGDDTGVMTRWRLGVTSRPDRRRTRRRRTRHRRGLGRRSLGRQPGRRSLGGACPVVPVVVVLAVVGSHPGLRKRPAPLNRPLSASAARMPPPTPRASWPAPARKPPPPGCCQARGG